MQGLGWQARAGGIVALLAVVVPAGAGAQHACDELGDAGWRTVPTVETVASVTGKPYRGDAPGTWYADRTVTVLPFCHFYNAVGNYSLRSYSLAPETRTERIEICRGDGAGGSVAVAPHAGRCPPG